MKRLGALAAAIALIAGAFVVRGIVTGDDGDDGLTAIGSSDGDDTALCPTGFGEICRSLETASTASGAGRTADALIDASSVDALGADAWIVPRAWAELVVDERERLRKPPLFEIDDDPIASSGVAITVWADRQAQLEASCELLDWRCLAEQDGQQLSAGDRVKGGIAPVDSALGLPVAATQAGAILGTQDFAANDFDAAFRSLAQRLASHQGTDPLGRMRSRGPGELTAAGVVLAEASTTTSTFGTITSIPIAGARIDIVALVPSGTRLAGDVRRDLAAAFRSAGWDDPPADPTDDGLPPGGVLAAVRTVWTS